MKLRRVVEQDTVGKDCAVGNTHDPRVDRTDAHWKKKCGVGLETGLGRRRA